MASGFRKELEVQLRMPVNILTSVGEIIHCLLIGKERRKKEIIDKRTVSTMHVLLSACAFEVMWTCARTFVSVRVASVCTAHNASFRTQGWARYAAEAKRGLRRGEENTRDEHQEAQGRVSS